MRTPPVARFGRAPSRSAVAERDRGSGSKFTFTGPPSYRGTAGVCARRGQGSRLSSSVAVGSGVVASDWAARRSSRAPASMRDETDTPRSKASRARSAFRAAGNHSVSRERPALFSARETGRANDNHLPGQYTGDDVHTSRRIQWRAISSDRARMWEGLAWRVRPRCHHRVTLPLCRQLHSAAQRAAVTAYSSRQSSINRTTTCPPFMLSSNPPTAQIVLPVKSSKCVLLLRSRHEKNLESRV